LAIAPSSRGFGFAVVEGQETLVDWGVKSVKGDKNANSLTKIEELLTLYSPGLLVLPDLSAASSRRSARIRELGERIAWLASSHNLKVRSLSRKKVQRYFPSDTSPTKHTIAEILAGRFPEELGARLPPKRQPWMNQDYRMDIFEAVSLAVASGLPTTKSNQV
jgi:hypothetical protein